MTYVWTAEQIERYRGYYGQISTHHTSAWASFATSEEFARSVLPPCLKPAEEPAVTVAFGAFMEWIGEVPNRAGRDRAMLIGINARYGGEEGVYYLTVVEEEEVNISTGRELWGMPKKQGTVDFYEDGEQFFGFSERKGHRLVEMQGQLGEPPEVESGEESSLYFELRGYFGANMGEVTGAQLVVFENRDVTKSYRALTDVRVELAGSPFDPGVGTIPLGELLDGGYGGGETSYSLREAVELDGDGNDYEPYLLGRLYDDWPDVRQFEGRAVGAARDAAR